MPEKGGGRGQRGCSGEPATTTAAEAVGNEHRLRRPAGSGGRQQHIAASGRGGGGGGGRGAGAGHVAMARCALLRAPIPCSRARSGSRDRLGQETHPYARSRAARVARLEMLRKQSVQIFGLVPAAVARASGRAAPGEPWHIQACPLGARPARMAAGPVVTSTPVVGSGCRGGARAPPAAPHPAHPGVDSRFALATAQSAPPMQPNGVGPSARAVPARPHGARNEASSHNKGAPSPWASSHRFGFSPIESWEEISVLVAGQKRRRRAAARPFGLPTSTPGSWRLGGQGGWSHARVAASCWLASHLSLRRAAASRALRASSYRWASFQHKGCRPLSR